MPKIKTNRGAAKRFTKTAGGFKRNQAHRRHKRAQGIIRKTMGQLSDDVGCGRCDNHRIGRFSPFNMTDGGIIAFFKETGAHRVSG